MAKVTIRGEERTLTDAAEIGEFLGRFGIWFRHFDGGEGLTDSSSDEEVLAAYGGPVDELKREGGYVTADVVQLRPETENLQAMLDKFNKEHWHADDEVRFVVGGRGLFHIRPEGGPVFAVEVGRGDLINVPRETLHWFDLCEERAIRCIRLFQDPEGWKPHYTGSGEESRHQPLCLGPGYIPPAGDR